jgi:hypothetical protein
LSSFSTPPERPSDFRERPRETDPGPVDLLHLAAETPATPMSHRDTEALPAGGERPDDAAVESALDLLHKTRDFLSLCLSQSESALESADPSELIEALRAIRGGAEEMASSPAVRLKRLEGDGAPEVGRRSA